MSSYSEMKSAIPSVSPKFNSKDFPGISEPVVMSFGSEAEREACGLQIASFEGKPLEPGRFEFTQDENDIGFVRLSFCEFGRIRGTHRIMPKFDHQNAITEKMKYVRLVYRCKLEKACPLTLLNNVLVKTRVLEDNPLMFDGQWRITKPVDISSIGGVDRFINGLHCTIGIDSNETDAVLDLRELVFFESYSQACAYYGDIALPDVLPVLFGFGGNCVAEPVSPSAISVNDAERSIVTVMSGNGQSWSASVDISDIEGYAEEFNCFRLAYKISDADGASVTLSAAIEDGEKEISLLSESPVVGQTAMTGVVRLDEVAVKSLACGGKLRISVSSDSENVKCRLDGAYFFHDEGKAASFVPVINKQTISVDGHDISKYSIIHSRKASPQVMRWAEKLKLIICQITGKKLEISDDRKPAGAYEILIGNTNRIQSAAVYGVGGDMWPSSPGFDVREYRIGIDGGKLVIAANCGYGIVSAVKNLIKACLGYNQFSFNPIKLKSGFVMKGVIQKVTPYTAWGDAANVDNPVEYDFDFSSDDRSWCYENSEENWKITDNAFFCNAFVCKNTPDSFAYLHLFEKNITVSADFCVTVCGEDSEFGIAARHTDKYAYVKAGYDKVDGCWFIDSRCGEDFELFRLAKKEGTLVAGKKYSLKLVCFNKQASLWLDGEKILETDSLTQLTPGRPGLFAENSEVSVSHCHIVLQSGQGTLIKDVYHTILDDKKYAVGTTVYELKDFSVVHLDARLPGLRSTDGGRTWQEVEGRTGCGILPQILRLSSGELMRVCVRPENDVKYIACAVSDDDGVTWKNSGVICTVQYQDYASCRAINMNDKLTQMSDGRIFYVQNYEVRGMKVDGRNVFCVFYYSDDKGATWKKSQTDSWTIEGNEKEAYFGECKILETAEHKLRMYNSWNCYDCIVYSDSEDNGVTWGPLHKMPEFICPRSTMQFARDPYAENNTTYYMVWVYSRGLSPMDGMNRSRLCLARTVDGINWSYLGDIWRWNHAYNCGTPINQIVNPFVFVAKDRVYCGSGFSARIGGGVPDDITSINYHQYQVQHVYSIDKKNLEDLPLPPVD